MRTLVPLAAALAALVLASNLACGSSSGGSGGAGGSSGGCDAAGHCTVTIANLCTDYSNASIGQSGCEQAGATWASGSCPSHGIGGCRISVTGICSTAWYPTSGADAEAALKQSCEQNAHGTWTSP